MGWGWESCFCSTLWSLLFQHGGYVWNRMSNQVMHHQNFSFLVQFFVFLRLHMMSFFICLVLYFIFYMGLLPLPHSPISLSNSCESYFPGCPNASGSLSSISPVLQTGLEVCIHTLLTFRGFPSRLSCAPWILVYYTSQTD